MVKMIVEAQVEAAEGFTRAVRSVAPTDDPWLQLPGPIEIRLAPSAGSRAVYLVTLHGAGPDSVTNLALCAPLARKSQGRGSFLALLSNHVLSSSTLRPAAAWQHASNGFALLVTSKGQPTGFNLAASGERRNVNVELWDPWITIGDAWDIDEVLVADLREVVARAGLAGDDLTAERLLAGVLGRRP